MKVLKRAIERKFNLHNQIVLIWIDELSLASWLKLSHLMCDRLITHFCLDTYFSRNTMTIITCLFNNLEILKNVHVSRRVQINNVLIKNENKSNFRVVILDVLKIYENLSNEDKTYELSKHDSNNHVINVIDEKQYFHDFIYLLSKAKLKVLKAYIDKHFVNDFIWSIKSSIDVSILFVRKKNDNLRLCVNYRDLNALTIKNRYSLSFIDESLNRFNRVKRFTSLNLTTIYHKMHIKKSDEWKTIFRTRYDHFEYQILSFELINVSIIFQDFINRILTIKLNVNVIVYLNDIVIYFEDSTTHLNDVKWMLNKLKKHKL